MRSRLHSIIFPLVFLGLFCLNTFLIQSSILGALLLIVYLVLIGLSITGGSRPSPTNPTWIGIWIALSIVMILGSVAYYVASVPAMLFQGIVIVSTAILFWKPFRPPLLYKEGLGVVASRIRSRMRLPIVIATLCALFLLGLLLHFIQSHPIVNAIRSPWQQIHPSILILFALTLLIVSVFLYRGREKSLSLILFILLIGSLFSFIAIAYPIGYGFDSFIHKATESHLAEFGTITPKPFYYIGQYALVLFFSHAFSLPIDLVDTWLLPLLASILLPLAWFNAANTILKKPRYALLTLLGLFLLPLDAFIVTTPQGLANLWILLAVLASVPWLFDEASPNWWIAALATISTLLIHPIAGIPLFFFFALLFLSTNTSEADLPPTPSFVRRRSSKRVATWIVVAVGSLALPASFIVQSIKSGQGLHLLSFSPSHLLQSMNLDVFFQSRFNPLIDFVYVYGQNIFLIALLVSFGAWWIYRNDLSPKIRVLFLMVIILGVNYLLLANVIDFSFLIDYERANYANRIIPLLLFFASPFMILAFGHLSMNLRTKPIALKLTCLVLLTMIGTASFYLTFPRVDAYTTSHAFNVSQADVDAVYTIENWSNGEPYIVLANQSVSAAAIKNIGFRYYGDFFFYPIPTGETMYQKFLAMSGGAGSGSAGNTTPSRTVVDQALALIPKDENVHTLYYVVDTYWWHADQLIEQSKAIADDWKSVDGSVYVFRFDVK